MFFVFSEAHVNIRLLNPSLAYKFDDWENKEIVTGKDFTLQNNDLSAAFTKDGFLKAVTLKQETNVVTIPVHLSFVKLVFFYLLLFFLFYSSEQLS